MGGGKTDFYLYCKRGMVSLSIPKAYGPRVRAALDANPTSVQLRNQNTNWYALGMRLAKL